VTGSATVVGGGPAGLMAAEMLAGAGLAVTVFEHMPSVGRKLLLAGRSGLNITHSEPIGDLLSRYGPEAGPLDSAVRAFGPQYRRSWDPPVRCSRCRGEPHRCSAPG
jgi:predicted flavoprotein YhiN